MLHLFLVFTIYLSIDTQLRRPITSALGMGAILLRECLGSTLHMGNKSVYALTVGPYEECAAK